MPKIKFTLCGCEVDTDNFEVEKVPTNCRAVWDLLARGDTKGVFQLESNLGKQWAMKVSPQNVEELSALTALLRPGCLESGMAEQYVKVKNGEEKPTYIHPALEYILGQTYGQLIFQEQAMAIAVILAGFSDTRADDLRKGIGKKTSSAFPALKKDFVEGAVSLKEIKVGDKVFPPLTANEAEEIFGWIEKFQRYGFNKCLSPATVVETTGGFKVLEDVSVGDLVKTPSGYAPVVDKCYNGHRDVFRVTLEDGKFIECTIDHKFMCEDGIIRPLYEILEKNIALVVE